MPPAINLLGIFGYPISHSLSSYMHNSVFKKMSLPYYYVPFEINPSNLERALQSMRVLGIKGVNITVPHKENVIKYLDEVSPSAKLIGAVNTVKNEKGKLIGYNTDGRGFVLGLKKDFGIAPEGKSFLILGAGGSARSIAFQLALDKSAKIFIANRTISRAKQLADNIKNSITSCYVDVVELSSLEIEHILKDVDFIINTTSLGMKNTDPLPINQNLLSKVSNVIDIIYNPEKTNLLIEAEKNGAKIANGLNMLIYQGVEAFEIWTGIKPPVEIMRNALLEQLKKLDKN